MSDLLKSEVEFLGRRYSSRLWAASGTFGWGLEAVDGGFWPKALGSVVTKGVSPEPMDGAPHPRIFEVGHGVGLLNAIGLQNPGLQKFLTGYARRYADGAVPVPVWVNVLGSSLEGYTRVVREVAALARSGSHDWLAGFELNVSCPNVDKGGVEFGSDARMLSDLVKSCVEASQGFAVMVKLSPAATDPVSLARASVDAGARALAVANTMPSGVPEPERRSAKGVSWSLGRRFGGLSGPALRPIALRVIDLIRSKVDVPMCGIGGIFTAHDAREFFAAGADVVQVGTAHFANPWVCNEIARELKWVHE